MCAMNDDFIGRTFGENNQVEVVGWFGERRGYSPNPIPLEKLEKVLTDVCSSTILQLKML